MLAISAIDTTQNTLIDFCKEQVFNLLSKTLEGMEDGELPLVELQQLEAS